MLTIDIIVTKLIIIPCISIIWQNNKVCLCMCRCSIPYSVPSPGVLVVGDRVLVVGGGMMVVGDGVGVSDSIVDEDMII